MQPERKDKSVSRQRVVHLTTAHYADDVRIFDRECRSLATCGLYDVSLAAPGLMPSESSVHHIQLPMPKLSRFARFISGPRVARQLVKHSQFDLWHFHDPELIPVALSVVRLGGTVIWDAHEDYVEQFTSEGAKSWVPRWLRRPAQWFMARLLRAIDLRAHGVVAATASVAQRYQNPKTTVVGNETRLELFASCVPSYSSRRLLFTGSPTDLHLFSQVIKAVVEIPDVVLHVAGHPPTQSVWDWATGLLGDRLTHLGWLSREELAAAMDGASLGLLTYADTGPYADGSPTKGFEFAAAGLPAIATPNKMNRLAIGSNGAGFLSASFDSDGLRDAILFALADSVRWNDASLAARHWASREGSWVNSERRLLTLYEQILFHDHPDDDRK